MPSVRRDHLLVLLLRIILGATGLLAAAILIFIPQPAIPLAIVTALLLVEALSLILVPLGKPELSGRLLTAGLCVAVIAAAYSSGGARYVSYSLFVLVIFTGGLVLGRRSIAILASIGVLAGLAMLLLELHGDLPVLVPGVPVISWLAVSLVFLCSAWMLYQVLKASEAALQRARLEMEERELAERSLKQVCVSQVDTGNVLKRRVLELDVLRQVAAACATGRNEDRLIEQVHQILGQLYSPQHCRVQIFSAEPDPVPSRPLTLANGDQGKEAVGGAVKFRRVLAGDQLREVVDAGEKALPVPADSGGCSELCIPLKAGEELLGEIKLKSENGVALGDSDESLLLAVGNQLAPAIARLRLSRALQLSEARYRDLFDGLPVGLFQATSAGVILNANQALVHLLGYPDRQYICGTRLQDWFADPAAYRRWREGMETNRQVHRFEAVYRRRDGEAVSLNGGAVASAGDTGYVYAGWLQDPSERNPSSLNLHINTRRLEMLRDMDRAILSAQSPHAIAEVALEHARELLPCRRASVALIDRETGKLTLFASQPERDVLFEKGKSLAFSALISREEVQQYGYHKIDDLQALSPRSQVEEMLAVQGIRSCLILALRSQNELTGLLYLDANEPAAFQQEQVDIGCEVADSLAVALQNARLFEQTGRRMRYLQALHRVDLSISSSIHLHQVLKVLLEQAKEQLHVDACTVLLLDAQAQTLTSAGRMGFHTGVLSNLVIRVGESYAGQAALEQRLISVPDLEANPGGFRHSLSLSGEGFVSYYAVPLLVKGQVKGVLEIFHRSLLSPDPEWLEFLLALATQAAIAIENASLFRDLQHSHEELALAYDTTLEGWSRALELRDQETEGHAQRVTELTVQLAQAMGVQNEMLGHLRRGALLHDIGKMVIPDSILLKEGPLTDEEWEVMHRHPEQGYELLAPITFLQPALDIPYAHHERWDGSGYPQKLKGDEIPLAARIFAVVDVWDALTYDRPYRKAWSPGSALAYVQAQAGHEFDPQVVAAFTRLMQHKLGLSGGQKPKMGMELRW